MNLLHIDCKPALALEAKCLKNGAGYRIRTRGPLITNRVASLKTKANLVNRRRDAPAITDTYRVGVNQIATPTRLNAEGAARGA